MASNNKFTVENLEDGHDSAIRISQGKADELQLRLGDIAKIQGKKVTVCIVQIDESCPNNKILMNEVVRRNLQVSIGDTVTIEHAPGIEYGTNVQILPIMDTVKGYNGNILEDFLKPFFLGTYRPIHISDTFPMKSGSKTVEFKVVNCKPGPFCIVAPETLLHCEGVIKREDADNI